MAQNRTLIDWHGVLSGTQQSWANYGNLHVEWWPSIWSGAEVSGTSPLISLPWQRKLEKRRKSLWWEADVLRGLVVLIWKTGNEWDVCSYQIFSLEWKFGQVELPLTARAVETHMFQLSNSKLKCLHWEVKGEPHFSLPPPIFLKKKSMLICGHSTALLIQDNRFYSQKKKSNFFSLYYALPLEPMGNGQWLSEKWLCESWPVT